MLKSLASTTLETLVNWLPSRVQKAAIERVAPRVDSYLAFQALGRRLGVRDIRVDGRYGLVEGSIDDGSVLAGYGTTKVWASETNHLFIDFFEAHGGGTYIDIGANIGLTTLPVARNSRVTCLAVEPEPRTYGYLTHNVRRNCPHGNVTTLNIALFDHRSKIDFELADRNGGDHRIRVTGATGPYGEEKRKVIQVTTETLDAVLDRNALKLPIAAKIDTQGAECQVFAGGQEILSRADLIAFEYWPYGIRRMGGDFNFLVDFVSRHFNEGALANGDCAESLRWCRIEAIADKLSAVWHSEPSAFPYFDVFVRK